MSEEVIDISKFERSNTFYGEIPLLLTIKNFDLEAIRARYINSKKNVSGRGGSVERREAGEGGLATLSLENGQIKNCEVLIKLKEPRGIDCKDQRFAFSSESSVYIIDDEEVSIIEDEWFSYIHTVNFSPWNNNMILISSSGFDCIFEFDLGSKKKTYEWFAWENGFSEGISGDTGVPFILTRNEDEANNYQQEGIAHQLINSPATTVLPTATRAAFINSVFYDDQDESQLLATFFHEGKIYGIDRMSGDTNSKIEGLSKPHGGRNYKDGFLVTSTGSGEIVTGNKGETKRYSLANLNDKPTELGDMEWVQNTVAYGNLLIAIDSNRTGFVIIDPEEGYYDIIRYDKNWAVQDAVIGVLNDAQIEAIRSIR